MASLSQAASKSVAVALANNVVAPEVIQTLADARASADQDLVAVAAIIVATNTSQTIDFGGLKVGDKVLVVPAAAGNSHFVTIATAGTLGEAAVVGSLYVVMRLIVLQTATAVAAKF